MRKHILLGNGRSVHKHQLHHALHYHQLAHHQLGRGTPAVKKNGGLLGMPDEYWNPNKKFDNAFHQMYVTQQNLNKAIGIQPTNVPNIHGWGKTKHHNKHIKPLKFKI